MKKYTPLHVALLALFSSISSVFSQQKPPATEVAGIPINYDEGKDGNYTLPDVLALQNGRKAQDSDEKLKEGFQLPPSLCLFKPI